MISAKTFTLKHLSMKWSIISFCKRLHIFYMHPHNFYSIPYYAYCTLQRKLHNISHTMHKAHLQIVNLLHRTLHMTYKYPRNRDKFSHILFRPFQDKQYNIFRIRLNKSSKHRYYVDYFSLTNWQERHWYDTWFLFIKRLALYGIISFVYDVMLIC